jgi:hypothetical protein
MPNNIEARRKANEEEEEEVASSKRTYSGKRGAGFNKEEVTTLLRSRRRLS